MQGGIPLDPHKKNGAFMGKVASVNYNSRIYPNFKHNIRENLKNAEHIFKDRSHLNSYFHPKASKNNFEEYFKQLHQKAKNAFFEYCKSKNGLAKSTGKPKGLQNFAKRNNCLKEFIYEIKEDTTGDELIELTKKIAELTGFTPMHIARHRDEGYINDKGQFIEHCHAHAIFFTLDSNGLQLARIGSSMNKKTLSQIQTEAARILNMPRGRFYKDLKIKPRKINDVRVYKELKYLENEKQKKEKALQEKINTLQLQEQRMQIFQQKQRQELESKEQEVKKIQYQLEQKMQELTELSKKIQIEHESLQQERIELEQIKSKKQK